MSSTEVEKLKREDAGETNGKNEKPREDNGGLKRAAPPDEEVEEFFAIVKRIRVAMQYFQRRDGDGNGVRGVAAETAALPTWSPSFEREDFDGIKTDPESSCGPKKTGLDLNSDPASEDPDS